MYEILAAILASGVVILVANKLIDMLEAKAATSKNSIIRVLGSSAGLMKKAVVVLVAKASDYIKGKMAKKEKK